MEDEFFDFETFTASFTQIVVSENDGSASKTQTQTQTQSNEPVTVSVTDDNNVLSDDALAAKYRSDADRLFKEAKRLREQAEERSPTKKKKKTEEESA